MRKIRTKLFETVTQKVKETTLRFDPNAEVILFGSRARGDYRKDSDWDFLILTNLLVDWKFKDKIRDDLYLTELEVEQVINTVIKNTYEYSNFGIMPLFQNIKQEGIKL